MKKISYWFLGIGVTLGILSIALTYFSTAKYNKLVNQFETNQSNIQQLQDIKESSTSTTDKITDDMIGLIEIPSINLKYPILEGIDDSVLKQAVGHFPSSALPGEGSNITLIGHNNFILAEPFKRLSLVSEGDIVNIITQNTTYKYQVVKYYVVDAYNTDIVSPSEEEKLTLVTCTGDARERFVVEALLAPETPSDVLTNQIEEE